MKSLLLLAAVLAATATPSLAARRIPVVAAYRAGQAQGSVLAVRGRAEVREDVSHAGLDVILHDETGRMVFIGFIPRLNQYAFPQAESMNGKTVVMYGVIELYRGVAATQLIYTDQLRLG
jgi:hypothetical protein